MISPTRRVETYRTSEEPTGLESEPQTEAGHKGVDGVEWEQIVRAEGSNFSDDRLRVGDVEEVDGRNQVRPLIEGKVARKAQVEQVHARQTLYTRLLKDDRLADRNRNGLTIGQAGGVRGLERIPGVMLKVNAGSKLPRQLVAAVHLENIRRVAVQVVVLAVYVQVRIGEVVSEGVVPTYRPGKEALLALDSEPAQYLPLVR